MACFSALRRRVIIGALMKNTNNTRMIIAILCCAISIGSLCTGEELQPDQWKQRHTVLSQSTYTA